MKKNNFMSISIIFVCVVLFLILMMQYQWYRNKLNEQFETQSIEKIMRSNATASSSLNFRLSSQIQLLNQSAQILSNSRYNHGSSNFIKELYTQSQLFDGVLSIFPLTSLESLKQINSDPSANEAYYSLLYSGHAVLCYNFERTSNTTINIAVSFLDAENFPYILYLSYSIADFSRIMALPASNYGGELYIIHKNGTILATNKPELLNKNLFDSFDQMDFYNSYSSEQMKTNILTEKSGVIRYNDSEVEKYTYHSPLILSDLILIQTADADILKADMRKLADIANAFTNSVLIVVFTLVIFVFIILALYGIRISRNHNALMMEQQRYKITLSQLKDTIWEYDIQSNILTKSNPSVGIYCGKSIIPEFRDTLLKHKCIYPEDIPIFCSFCLSLVSSDKDLCSEFRATDISGNFTWFRLTGTKIFDANKIPISVIGQTVNIQMEKLALEQFMLKQKQDPLTKLYNLTAMEKSINEIFLHSETSLSALFLLDIDNFKKINNTLGYMFGDAMLMDLSTRLQKSCDESDILGRAGGDEFLIFIQDAASVSSVESKANKICQLFHDIYAGKENDFSLSGSIGIAIYPADAVNFKNLFEKAEFALCHAKSQGKDQYCFYSDQLPQLTAAEFRPVTLTEPDLKHFHSDQSLIDNTIISSVIDILFDSKEIDISITMALSMIGIYYKLDQIGIFEFSDNGQYLSLTHEWYSKPYYRLTDYIQKISVEAGKPFLLYSELPDGVFYQSNMEDIIPDSFYDDFKIPYRTKSFIQCGINNHGLPLGCLNMSICDNTHNWVQNEIDSLYLLSKIIGSYLIKLRSIQHAEELTLKDTLTGAYNFNAFLAESEVLINKSGDTKYVMVYSDIYQFKLINDNYGYQAGDEILKQLAKIYCSVYGADTLLCRVAGDKFVFMAPYQSKDELSDKAESLLLKSRQIYSPEGAAYKLSIMVGIYPMGPRDSAIVAVDRASIARKDAQKAHTSNYCYFNEKMRSTLIEQKEIEDLMEDALNNREFVVYYQPKINLETMLISGAEALVRWIRPDIGLVPPNSFIPLFEQNGFVVNIDYYVLKSVCARLKTRIDAGQIVYPISVNFSRQHFKSDILPDKLKEIVDSYKVPPHLIEVELTESALAADDHYMITMLNKIRDNGFRLSMDDFGSGLSSLNLLCDMPFNVLKIDKDFFHSKTTTKRECIVISSIVKMASELDMDVICEGVETVEQAEFLISIGCKMAQGYLFNAPMPETIFEEKYLSDH